MSDPSSVPPPAPEAKLAPTTPLRCVTGALLAGSMGFLSYRLTTAIALAFAAHPVRSSNQLVQSISVAVRTLVVGITTLGTGIFSLTALGLLALAVQLLLQRGQQQQDQPPKL